jgi:hypothetical protein
VSLNQGTSSWQGKNVEREPLPVIADRSNAARQVMASRGLTFEGALQRIDLQDRPGSLGEGYEYGNVLAFAHEFGASWPDADFISRVRDLELARRVIDPASPTFTPGAPYKPATLAAVSSSNEPLLFAKDPTKLERALRGHAATQNRVAELIAARGHLPLSPTGEPDFDVAWRTDKELFVVEVKSLPDGAETAQLRMGLGQVLQYRHALRVRYRLNMRAVIAVEREPPGALDWTTLMKEVGVLLTWGPEFTALVRMLDGPG